MEQKMCDERHNRIDARLKLLEQSVKDFSDVVVAIKELAVETKYMREDLNNTVSRLEKLEHRDLDKWEKFKWAILVALISATVGIFIGYLATTTGLK